MRPSAPEEKIAGVFIERCEALHDRSVVSGEQSQFGGSIVNASCSSPRLYESSASASAVHYSPGNSNFLSRSAMGAPK